MGRARGRRLPPSKNAPSLLAPGPGTWISSEFARSDCWTFFVSVSR